MKKFYQWPGERRLSVTCFCALLLLIAQAGEALSADYWLPVERTGCQVWADEPLASREFIRWSGGYEAGKLSGEGLLKVFEGDRRTLRFAGEMRAGKAEGPGKLELSVKDGTERYTGAFAQSLANGYGLYELADGSRYEGGFRDDKPEI